LVRNENQNAKETRRTKMKNTKNARTTKTTETAAQAYERNTRDINAMIEFLKMEMEKHAERQAAEPRNWGFAGDLAQIRQNLKETLVFAMGARDEEVAGKMIEDAIADANA